MPLEIYIWDVNHGNSAWIKLPAGLNMMIDCGSNPIFNFSPIAFVKRLGVNELDYLIISHPHLDHIRDISNIDLVNVRTLLRPNIGHSKLDAEIIASSDNAYNIIMRKYMEFESRYQTDTSWENDPCNPSKNGGVSIYNIGLGEESDDLNDYSMFTFLKYGQFCFATAGDLTTSAWRKIIEKNRNNAGFINLLRSINFFEASHHGREEGFCRELFDYASPYLVFVSDMKEQDTNATDRYSNFCEGFNVFDEIQRSRSKRNVLTTRSDGRIKIIVDVGIHGTTCDIMTKKTYE